MGTGGQSSTILVAETQSTPAELATQGSVFFNQVGDRYPLPAIQPAGQYPQHHLQRRGIDHEAELISQARLNNLG
jgi:hypothetical protein